jgi:hypothetical protein
MKNVSNAASGHRVEIRAAAGLVCLYVAVMSGHFLSIDGFVMWRQALALVYHSSWSFVPPIWWGGYLTTSGRGIGASLEYFPGLIAFPWLSGHVPVATGPQYDFRLLYADLLYVVAGAPIWVLITVATAYLVALTTRALGAERPAALWALAFYGLGSPALAASRGDWPQPLVALCWIGGFYASLRYLETGGRRWLWITAVAICYAVLTRPLEGSLLLPGVLVLVAARTRKAWWPLAVIGSGWVAAVAITLLLNWLRFGSPTSSGYGSLQLQWTTPIWVGLPGGLISPGRGIVWEFPAIALAVVGTTYLWRHSKRVEALALAGLPTVLLIEASTYVDWIGGWDWGFRFLQPALPFLAVLAGAGVPRLPDALRKWVPAALLAGGILWNVPVVATDILGGYGATYAYTGANFRLDAYPPIGAWRFLHHILATHLTDSAALDIVWFRATRIVGWVSLIPFVALIAASAALWISAVRSVRGSPTETPSNRAEAPVESRN